jgi:YceI-like domain
VSVPVGAAQTLRYTVSRAGSVLTFAAKSTLHSVSGKNTMLDGFIRAGIDEGGKLIFDPLPVMHLDFLVEQLRSGNTMLDQQMWKLIDSKRFPRITADLRTLAPTDSPFRFTGSGDITLAGRMKRYGGTIDFSVSGTDLIFEGDLDVDIRDFGLTPPNLLIIRVDPIVKVHLHLVANLAE